MSEARQLLYPSGEMVSLVQSLDRPQENGLFSQDVLVQYPELAESYTKVCPNRCDLTTAAERAAKDVYGYDVQLTTLKEDVKLMVNNCILFNGAEGPYADAARSFEKFAMGKIDAYISQKMGGRRLSSLRVAAAAMAEGHTAGKRNREGEPRGKELAAVDGGSSRRQPARVGKGGQPCRGTGGNTKECDGNDRSADLLKLINSLNRREDNGAFVVDVAETYPELKSAYEATCPTKMNLTIMKERAQNGYYHGQQHRRRRGGDTSLPYIGSSVAGSLTTLRDDVELMVNNCISFNSGVVEWEQLARSFHHFAHKKIDDFVLCVDPSLRGTQTGVEVYVHSAKKSPQERLKQRVEGSVQSCEGDAAGLSSTGHEASSFRVASATLHLARKNTMAGTPRVPAQPAHVNVNVVNTATPVVQPTALQPVFCTPDVLRRRLISDHLHRDTLHARLIQGPQEDGNNNDKVNGKGGTGGDHENPRVYGPSFSCRAVLDAFIASVRDFHKTQRESQDFVNPFLYAQQEENLYFDYVTLIKQQLERLFLHVVLYDREKAEMYDWAAARAAQRIVAGDGQLPTVALADSHFTCCWLEEVHLCYLVRFLQHLPQLLGLACAEVSPSKKDGVGNAELYLTSVGQGVIGKFAKITEELLSFIARYEEMIVCSQGSAELRAEQMEPLGAEMSQGMQSGADSDERVCASTHANSGDNFQKAPMVAEGLSYVYTCRMCRHVLFSHEEIMPHNADTSSREPKAFGRRGDTKEWRNQPESVACTSYFLNPDISLWVAAESREVHGESGGDGVLPDTVYCPNALCSAKIGKQSWVGSQCSCGVWVTPAFKIHSKAVDKIQSNQC